MLNPDENFASFNEVEAKLSKCEKQIRDESGGAVLFIMITVVLTVIIIKNESIFFPSMLFLLSFICVGSYVESLVKAHMKRARLIATLNRLQLFEDLKNQGT